MAMIDSKTNVYGVGMVLWSLLELEAGDHRVWWESEFAHDHDPEVLDEPAFRPRVVQKYSPQLRELILRCVRYNQADRPSFKEILQRIRCWTSNQSQRNAADESDIRAPNAPDLASGLRDAPVDDPLWTAGPHALEHKVDRWPLRSLLSTIKPPGGMGPFPEPPQARTDNVDLDRPGGSPGAEVNEASRSNSASNNGVSFGGKRLPGTTVGGNDQPDAVVPPPSNEPSRSSQAKEGANRRGSGEKRKSQFPGSPSRAKRPK